MVYVPGGQTTVGSAAGLPQEQPAFTAEVEPFLMDKSPITVAQFRAFVEATGYVTQAEAFGDAGIFDMEGREWKLVKEASWAFPLGPGGPAAEDDHPVTQVSWNDAVAYAAWAGKRLPTEVEREHAARNGRNDQSLYPWGNSLVEAGRYLANTWQVGFPYSNTVDDHFLYTSPVGTFGTTPLGLMDMGGNVWEWCDDWYRPYTERGQAFRPTAQSEKVIRGGSFLCDGSFCHGFRVSSRMGTTPETALFHTGFRLVKDI
jgi:sulfatase modifying factor 1